MMDRTLQEGAMDDSLGPALYPTPTLFLCFHGQEPLLGGARLCLRGVEEVHFGRGAETMFVFSEDGTKLQVTLADSQVSVRHGRLLLQERAAHFEDLGSTNGTYLGEERRANFVVPEGVIFTTGSAAWMFYGGLPSGDAPRTVTRSDATRVVPELDGMSSFVPAIANDLRAFAKIAGSDISLFIQGESGSGKEVLARAAHALSDRSARPFVALNCAAIPENLIESQLFGHVRGAFSGALRDEPGFFRAAHTGTLFLDEIGDMPPSAQAALLRALETREVVPVGATKSIPVDVRIIAATLRHDAALRPDLLARLAGYRHTLPALRARKPDMALLTANLLGRLDAGGARFAPDAVRKLMAHPFALNVRELAATLKSATLLAGAETGGHVYARHLALLAPTAPDAAPALQGGALEAATAASKPARKAPVSDEARKADLLKHLAEAGGNISEVARRMDTTRAQVHRWAQKFGVALDSFRKGGD
jgi:DNA-binding NtrC family response regulator